MKSEYLCEYTQTINRTQTFYDDNLFIYLILLALITLYGGKKYIDPFFNPIPITLRLELCDQDGVMPSDVSRVALKLSTDTTHDLRPSGPKKRSIVRAYSLRVEEFQRHCITNLVACYQVYRVCDTGERFSHGAVTGSNFDTTEHFSPLPFPPPPSLNRFVGSLK